MWNKDGVVLSVDGFEDTYFQSNEGHEIEKNKSIEALRVQLGRYVKTATIGADIKSM